MVKVFDSKAVGRRFESRSGQGAVQFVDSSLSTCTALRSKNKDWLAQDNMPEWRDMPSTLGLLLQ